MHYAKLGTSGIDVSRICLGCMGFGDPGNGQHAWTLGYDDSKAIMPRPWSEGITFFDTAMGYQNGTSEEYVGRALASLARREDVVVATKFVLGSLHAPAGEMPGEARHGVGRRQGRAPSRREPCAPGHGLRGPLHLPHVGLGRAHRGVAAGARSAGARGQDSRAGHFQLLCVATCRGKRDRPGKWVDAVRELPGHYNAIAREDEREMVPLAATHGIALTPYSALAGGRLSKHPGETSKRLRLDAYAHGSTTARRTSTRRSSRRWRTSRRSAASP